MEQTSNLEVVRGALFLSSCSLFQLCVVVVTLGYHTVHSKLSTGLPCEDTR